MERERETEINTLIKDALKQAKKICMTQYYHATTDTHTKDKQYLLSKHR